jgi:hypothetical protein
MDVILAETIVEACAKNGVKTELKKDYSPPWMYGKKTTGVVIVDGDLAQVIRAIVANAHLLVDGELPWFSIKNKFSISSFRLSLILY